MANAIRAHLLGRVHEELSERAWEMEGRSGTTRTVVILDEDANKVPVRFNDENKGEAYKLTKGTEVHMLVDIMSGKANYRGLVAPAKA